MGTVTGYTAERMDEISNKTVIDGDVNVSGHLILVCRDGSTIDAGSVVGPQGPQGIGASDMTATYQLLSPVGGVQLYGGATIPTGWLECNGQSLARAGAYANLFAAISTLYGAVDGTHFNVPNLQAKFPMGQAASGTGSTLGGTGGTADAIVVAHSHPHSHGGSTANANLSKHSVGGTDTGERIWITAGGAQNNTVPVTTGTGSAVPSHVDDHAPHSHTIGSDSTSSGVSGTGQNLPPFVAMKYIIRY